jgi:ferredoxin
MRVRVDPEVCQGYAQCNSLVPEVFELDDDGISSVLIGEVPPDLVDAVTEAVDCCPTGAIVLERDPAGADPADAG